jgi:hypothetical protein
MKAEREDLPQKYDSVPKSRHKASPRRDQSSSKHRRRDKRPVEREHSSSESGGRSGVLGGNKPKPIDLPQDTAELVITESTPQNSPRVVEFRAEHSDVLVKREKRRHSSRVIALPCAPKLKFTVQCKHCRDPVDGVMIGIAGTDLGPTDGNGFIEGSVEANEQPQRPVVTVPSTETWRYRADNTEFDAIPLKANTTEDVLLHVLCLIQPIVEVKLLTGRVVGAAVPNVKVTFAGADLGRTDGSGLATLKDGDQRYEAGNCNVTIDPGTRQYFIALDADQPKPVNPFSVDLAYGQANKFTYYVRPRARPTIKVLCVETNKPVVNAKVAMAGQDFGLTNANGIATLQPDIWIDPGTFKIALVLDDASHKIKFEDQEYPRFVRRDSENDDQVITENDTRELLVKVHAVGALVVEVFRFDGQALHRRVTFDLADGPSAKTDLVTVDTPTDVDDRTSTDPRLLPRVKKPMTTDWVVPSLPQRKLQRDRLAVAELEAGKYKVKLRDVAQIKSVEKINVSSLEKWSIGPADNGEVAVVINPDKVSHVKFELTKVQKIQFVAFDIRPGTKRNPLATNVAADFDNLYLGEATAAEDIGQRCIVMKNAIAKAKSKASTDPDVLKVFMAPEFYFRGTEGAYPIEQLDTIMSEMRGFTSHADYKDWLFVFGTAIGYQRHSDYDPSTTLEPNTKYALQVHQVVGTTVTVKDGAKDKASVCSRIVASTAASYVWKAGGVDVNSAKPNTTDPSMFDVETTTALTLSPNDAIELVEPIASEVYNVAMVQRGGPAGGDAGLREAVIYKEQISWVDFNGIYSGKDDFWDKRKIEIHNQVRTALPTTGSTDKLAQSPNSQDNSSEFNATGLGGGSIFMAAGITFGLEVCRDHLVDRLGKYYGDSKASPGEPMVQVLLVPSMGASLDGGEVVGVDGALMFNVDGGKGSAAGKRSGTEPYSCMCHPTQKSSRRLKCTEVVSVREHYKCWAMTARGTCEHCGAKKTESIPDTSGAQVCPGPHGYIATATNCPDCGDKTEKLGRCITHDWGVPDSANNCPTCNVAMTGIQAFCFGQHTAVKNVVACPQHGLPGGGGNVCTTTPHRYLPTQLTCPVCATNNDIQGYCPGHNGWVAPSGGNCPTCVGPIALLNTAAFCFNHHTLDCSNCASHPKSMPVAQKLYYCTNHTHYEATHIACSVCHLPTQKDPNPVTYVMAQNAPAKTGPEAVDDTAGTYSVIKFDDKKVVDGSTVKTQFEEVPTTVTPDSKKLFGAKGNINVYAVMDVPAAQTVP